LKTQAKNLQKIAKHTTKLDSSNSKVEILSFASGKGGVGKSIIAANIAYLLSTRGKKVAILDASIGLANLDIIFNVKAESNLLNFVKGEKSLDEIMIEINKNLYFIPGESGDEILSYNIQDKLNSKLDFFDSFDYLILDIGSGISDTVQSFLYSSNEVILTTTPNPASITDVYTMIKIVSNMGKNINLIVNMANSEDESRFIYQNIQKVVHNNLDENLLINYLGSLNYSKNVSKVSKLRQLFSKVSTNSLSTYHLNGIIDNLFLNLGYENYSKKQSGSFSLFIKKLTDNF
jgi:flagellar biosynthesis protein FlhG